MLKVIEINPQDSPRASVIWLHGLGADGYDFLDIIPKLNLPQDLQVRFVFPHAPLRPITFANNEVMRAWFNVVELGINGAEDEVSIRESEESIKELIAAELARGIPSNKILLAGFSQGGAMALQCGLRHVEKLAGILVLSSWLPLKHTVRDEINQANQQTPILMLHGDNDDLVVPAWAKASSNYLHTLGCNVTFNSYPIGHSVCCEEIKTIGIWLHDLLR